MGFIFVLTLRLGRGADHDQRESVAVLLDLLILGKSIEIGPKFRGQIILGPSSNGVGRMAALSAPSLIGPPSI
jgi:hypothetical protein